MTQTPNTQEIIPPDYALSNQIEELNADIAYTTGFAGVALAGGAAGVVGVYAAPGSGALAAGYYGVRLAMQSMQLRSERRSLRLEERQGKTAAGEHYAQNSDLYHEQALRDAIAAGKDIKGWESKPGDQVPAAATEQYEGIFPEKRTTSHGDAMGGSEPGLDGISEGRVSGPLPTADEQG